MKTALTYIFAAQLFLCSIPQLAFAQMSASIVEGQQEIQLRPDTTARFNSFTAKQLEGKVYLNWLVAGLKEDGVFVIYRSADGINFTIAGTKPGTGVPVSRNIAYCFTDTPPADKTYQYKIFFIGSNKTFFNSEKITATNDFLSTIIK